MNGGIGSYPGQLIYEGGFIVAPDPSPTHETKSFVGWSLEKDSDVKYSFETPVTNDMTLYAIWIESVPVVEKTVTYIFTSNTWSANKTLDGTTTTENWINGKSGLAFLNGGIQVNTGASGANATSSISFSNVKSIEIIYFTNASKGVGTIETKVGDEVVQLFNVTKPSSGGGTPRSAGIVTVDNLSGQVKITVTCTTNSVFIQSINITYLS